MKRVIILATLDTKLDEAEAFKTVISRNTTVKV